MFSMRVVREGPAPQRNVVPVVVSDAAHPQVVPLPQSPPERRNVVDDTLLFRAYLADINEPLHGVTEDEPSRTCRQGAFWRAHHDQFRAWRIDHSVGPRLQEP